MGDLKEAKATPMLIHTLKTAGRAEKKKVMDAVGNKKLNGPAAKAITEIYRKHGAIECAQRLSRDYVDKARQALDALPPGTPRDRFGEILDVLGYWSMLAE